MTDEKQKPKGRVVEVLVPPPMTTSHATNDTDEDEDDAPAARGRARVALLPNWGSGKSATPDHLAIFRVEPPSGYLGKASLETDEGLLAQRFGGRVLRIELRAADGSKIPGANNSRMITIDSDPVIPPTSSARAAQGVPSSESAQWDRAEVLRTSAEERVQLLKAEIDSRAEREASRMRAELERTKLEHQQSLERERQRVEAEEQRAQRDIERERERAKAEREREREAHAANLAMITAANTATLQMMQSSHQQTMEMMARLAQQPQQDPLAALRVGVELATNLGQGASGDDATRSFDKLLDVAKEGMKTMRGPRLPPARGQRQIEAQTRANPSTGAGDASGPAPTADEKKARVKAKLAAAIKNLEANGHDLEELLDSLNGQMGAAAGAPADSSAPASSVGLDDFTGDD